MYVPQTSSIIIPPHLKVVCTMPYFLCTSLKKPNFMSGFRNAVKNYVVHMHWQRLELNLPLYNKTTLPIRSQQGLGIDVVTFWFYTNFTYIIDQSCEKYSNYHQQSPLIQLSYRLSGARSPAQLRSFENACRRGGLR